MNQAQFERLINKLDSLTDLQVRQLKAFLDGSDHIKAIVSQLEQRMVDEPECPHCHSQLINRHGRTDGTQRYRCKNCLKTFTATTKTPLARLRHKDKWIQYLACMIEGKVLRQSARECGIDLKTSFRWRHRFLQLPAKQKASTLQGIIEADETLFPYSEKGNKKLTRPARKRGMKAKKRGRSKEDWVPVLTVRDRSKQTYEAVLPSVTTEVLEQELKGKLERDSVLCSDGLKPYIKLAEDSDLIHKRLNVASGQRVIDKVFHVQNVNAYHQRLKGWMGRFHGVATKYLEHYLGWHRFLDIESEPDENNLFKMQQQLKPT